MMERKTFIPFGENKDFSFDFLIGMIEDARFTTLERVLEIENEELHWQYAEGWNSISVLLSHIYSVEMFFRIEFIEQREFSKEEELDIMPGLEMGEYIPQLISKKPLQFYTKRLEKSRELMRNAITNLSSKDFHRHQEKFYPKGCNLAWALYHMAEDEIHHRGQISIIRKLYLEKFTLIHKSSN